MGAHVFGVVLAHQLAGALHDAHDAGLADEHVVGLLGQHEAAGAGQGIEARFGEGQQLELAVAVGEVREHEEGQPVWRLFVEGLQDAWLVRVARVAFQHGLRLLAPVAPEMGVQQVDHGPQMAAFLDVDLEQVAQIVKGGADLAEQALLLDRGGLGVALGDDEAAQIGAVFAGHLLPGRLPLVHAEVDLAAFLGRRQENAPAVVRHAHVVVVGPALGADVDGGAQIDVEFLAFRGAEIAPPLNVMGLPVLQGALQLAVLFQADVVGNFFREVDFHGVTPVSCRIWPAARCRRA